MLLYHWEEHELFGVEVRHEVFLIELDNVVRLPGWIMQPVLERSFRALSQAKGKHQPIVVVTREWNQAWMSFGHGG